MKGIEAIWKVLKIVSLERVYQVTIGVQKLHSFTDVR